MTTITDHRPTKRQMGFALDMIEEIASHGHSGSRADSDEWYRAAISYFRGLSVPEADEAIQRLIALRREYRWKRRNGTTFEATEVLDGTYTVRLDDGHRVFKVVTQPDDAEFMPGRQIVHLNDGPDNVHDYHGVGDVRSGVPTLWARFRDDSVLAAAVALIGDDTLTEARCRRCNRPLTVPSSVDRGIGPVCAQKMGLA